MDHLPKFRSMPPRGIHHIERHCPSTPPNQYIVYYQRSTKIARGLSDLANWLRFGRRNFQPKRTSGYTRRILVWGYPFFVKLDDSPLPFEYLSGQTYGLNPYRSKRVEVGESNGKLLVLFLGEYHYGVLC